jgi:gamma-tubulin complex component 2
LCAADKSLVDDPAALKYLQSLYPSARHPVPERLKNFDPDGVAKIVESLEKYEENFNRHIRILLDALNYYAATETVALSRLCAQLSMASEKGGEERVRDE